MNESQKRLNFTDEQENSLNKLASTIEDFQGEFMLIFAHCNYMGLKKRLVQRLQEFCLVEKVVIQPSDITLYTTIQAQIRGKKPLAVMVLGLETVTNLQQMLASADQVREEFKKNFHFPLILWVNDRVQVQLMESAPNFENWGITKEFRITKEELAVVLKEEAEQIFTHNSPPRNHGEALALEVQIEAAQRDFHSSEDLELEANLQFLLGFVKDINNKNKRDSALEHYQKGLELWEQLGNLEKQGTILSEIAFCYYLQAFKQPLKHPDWQKTRDYLEQALQVWEQAKRPDLVANSIAKLGRILRKLEDWEQLKELAEKALEWHQKENKIPAIAEDYVFLAEVALAQEQWDEVINLSQEYLKKCPIKSENKPVFYQKNRRFYLIKARAQQHLGEYQEAIKFLQFVEQYSIDIFDIQLYLDILNDIHQFYFDNKEYSKAFEIKQRSQRTEYRYGQKAFIGASNLESKEISAFMTGNSSQNLPREIISSGRDRDVENLVQWVKRDDKKVIVIYGVSGVGKSSLIKAGLVPSLEQEFIGLEKLIPVYIRRYNNWLEELGKKLKKSLTKNDINLTNSLNYSEFILEQLQTNKSPNLRFVLILDQFEEFFFIANTEAMINELFEFLGKCLDIRTLKVIFSLRKDYLHLLLNRPGMTKISDDILGKNVLYEITNFSVRTAKSLIVKLTQQSNLCLEEDLIEELVKDLAEKDGQIRPIELQLVGAQLQHENITTLEKYRQSGPKEKLVEQYLAEAIADCGPENERFTQLLLYLLTNENNTRPLKTKAELEADLEVSREQLYLILEILEGSGLIVRVPETPDNRYQLVHDYLVSFIRQKYQPKFLELERTKQQLKQALYQQNEQRKRAEIAEIEALNSLSQALLLSHDQLGALVASVKAGIKLKEITAPLNIHTLTVSRLSDLIQQIQELNRFQGHSRGVNSICFSPDGQILASASGDGTIKLWNLDGIEQQIFQGHSGWVNSICFSPDGQILASASGDGTIKLWNLDGMEQQIFQGHSSWVNSVCFSPDGQIIASASTDSTVKLWTLGGIEIQTFQGHKDSVNSVCFSPDGQIIASASTDGTIKLWKLNRPLRRLGFHNFFTGVSGELSEMSNGFLLLELKGHSSRVNSVCFSPDSQIIASASTDGTVKLWTLGGIEIQTFQGHKDSVNSICFSPDGQVIASASTDSTVKLWTLGGIEIQTLHGYNDDFRSVCFSSDNQTLALASANGTLRLWLLSGLQLGNFLEHSGLVYSISFSPDGQIIASAGYDRKIKLSKLDGTEVKTFQGHSRSVNSLSFSPNGYTIASASDDYTIKLWNLNNTEVQILQGHTREVNSVSFSPDGQIIASVSDGGIVKLWNNKTEISSFRGSKGRAWSICFSPDGQTFVLACADGCLRLWNINGKKLRTINAHIGAVYSVCFSPNGQIIASAGDDHRIRLWNISGRELRTLSGHAGAIYSVCFSPNGQTLASAGGDSNVKLWSLDGTNVITLKGHGGLVRSISFSPDGQTLASAGDDGKIILWRFNLDNLLVLGCQWLRNYLKNNPNVSESDRRLCDDICTYS